MKDWRTVSGNVVPALLYAISVLLVGCANSTPTPVSPPFTPIPQGGFAEIVGVVSSEASGLWDRVDDTYEEPDPENWYRSFTVYVTEVIEGKSLVEPGETIIIHRYGMEPKPRIFFQPGMVIRTSGEYRADTGIMRQLSDYYSVEDLGETSDYDHPAVVGGPGDIVRIDLKSEPFVEFSPGDKVGCFEGYPTPGDEEGSFEGYPILQLVDVEGNWAQIISGTLYFGQAAGCAGYSVQALKTPHTSKD